MFSAVNGMLLNVLAAVARMDYDDRRRRQEQGQAKAKTAGLYRDRREDKDRNDGIASMLRDERTYSYGIREIRPGRSFWATRRSLCAS